MTFKKWYNSKIIKLDWLKNKRILLVVSAIVFIALLFFLKTKSEYKNDTLRGVGLTPSDVIVEDLLQKDTDLDGILDWEEGLLGTDSTKKDTDDDGIPDSSEIAKIKSAGSENGEGETTNQEENLTQTDKFSRELFSTVAALNQTGQMDQTTVDKLTTSLVDQIKNSSTEKVFLMSELKIINGNNLVATKNYNNAMGVIMKGYPIIDPVEVLKKSITDTGDIDTSILPQLDPFINQTKKIIVELVNTEVPQDFSLAHLNMINALEKVSENLSDIKLIDSDAVLALNAASQYEENYATLDSATYNLKKAIWKKLNI